MSTWLEYRIPPHFTFCWILLWVTLIYVKEDEIMRINVVKNQADESYSFAGKMKKLANGEACSRPRLGEMNIT